MKINYSWTFIYIMGKQDDFLNFENGILSKIMRILIANLTVNSVWIK